MRQISDSPSLSQSAQQSVGPSVSPSAQQQVGVSTSRWAWLDQSGRVPCAAACTAGSRPRACRDLRARGSGCRPAEGRLAMAAAARAAASLPPAARGPLPPFPLSLWYSLRAVSARGTLTTKVSGDRPDRASARWEISASHRSGRADEDGDAHGSGPRDIVRSPPRHPRWSSGAQVTKKTTGKAQAQTAW